MGVTCNRECIDNSFGFVVQVNVTPNKDSLNIGDTLWLESVTPSTMVDLNSNKEIIFDHASNLGGGMRVGELLAANNMADAVNNFDFVISKGDASNVEREPNRSKSFKYLEEKGLYELKIGIVCRKKGIYGLFLSAASNVYSPRYGSCGRATIYLKFKNANKHIQYLQDTYYSGYVIPDAVIESSYCFRVF
jgi:hypothetical protein